MSTIHLVIRLMIGIAGGGLLMGMTVRRFLPAGKGRLRKAVPCLLFALVLLLPSWIGDENPLFLFPFFLAVFLFCHSGPWMARLVTGFIFYTLLIPLSMVTDTIESALFFKDAGRYEAAADLLAMAVKLLLWGLIWFAIRRSVPRDGEINLSGKLWALLGGLSLAPLFATLSFAIWNRRTFHVDIYSAGVQRIAFTVLPFAALSSLALLFAIVVLSRHESLEQEQKLAELREVYYQGLQREQTEVRTLRHDMNNHLAAVQGLLEQGDGEGAGRYLKELSQSPSLQGSKRLCGNDIANAVLSSKLTIMEREGIRADFEVSLPPKLAISDIDLCALLGNALDNAIEAARGAPHKAIALCARAGKGTLMLHVENTLEREPKNDNGVFQTTKWDKTAHGFGLAGMREIARRYGGSLETKAENGRFDLVVYLYLDNKTPD